MEKHDRSYCRMKKLFAIFAILFCACHSFSQDKSTVVEFGEYIHDFGNIREIDGPQSHTFTYRNAGKTPLIIYNIDTSCGCTTPKYDHSPLMPGQTRKLVVEFDPANQPGRVEKTIIIRGNIENGSTTLKVRALVEPRPRTVEDHYPVSLTDGVRMQDVAMELGNQPRTKTTVHTMGIVNTSDKTVMLSVDPRKQLPPWVKAQVSTQHLGAGEKAILNVTLNPQEFDLWGHKAFPVGVLVNGRAQYIDVIVMTTFIEDLAVNISTTPPRAELNGNFYHFSSVKHKQNVTHSFTLKNNGEGVLYIRNLDHAKDLNVKADKTELKKGEVATIIVQIDAEEIGPLNEIIRIITNDPMRPVQELRVMANVIK